MLRTLLMTLLLATVTPLCALTVENIDIPQVTPATADSPEMTLRGASVRRVYGFVEVYVGALYLQNGPLEEQEIIRADEARRMVFYVTSERVSARRFTNAIQEGLAINISKDEMAAMSERVSQLVSLFDHKFVAGTVGYIEWVPDQQVSRIVIDDSVRGTVPGKDLNDALLKIWIGDHPVSERFKEEVLGRNNG
ncbi:MAG: chalcone isomerase family protein [Saccharospirillaceae bacterium]|nr:chalcone isomerase family protein [Saccharospirillaceae bacterium]MCD8530440.1 chalcone isomerase family protein [Saccharospirillaceae bacterium]